MFIVYRKSSGWDNWDAKWKSEDGFLQENLFVKKDKGIKKFYKDQCFGQGEKLFVAFNGVLLNSAYLFQKYKVSTVESLINLLYGKDKEFFREFRGNFNGCVYDMDKKSLLVFADHLSNKPIFYFEDKEYFVAGASVWEIAEFCREEKKLKLDRGGCYSLLTYAYMYHDRTIFDGIKRLLPGWYAFVKNGGVAERRQFYEITSSKQVQMPMEEAIDKLDGLFANAIKMQIEKNKEYGYANYAPLSAGLDSRITTMALNRFQAEDIINFTYSETGQLDQKIPMKIAKDLGNPWLFKSLDGGWELFHIERAIELGESLIYYAWPAQLGDFMELVNSKGMGIVHTGVIGDVVVGTFVNEQGEASKRYKIGDGAYSRKLLRKLKENIDEASYESYEIGMMHNRAINGASMGYSTTFRKYAEACSPFMDVDFMGFCFSLPTAYRFQHRIYYRWIERHYPKAMDYSHNGLKISTSRLGISIKGKFIKFNTIPSRMKILAESHIRKGYGMNPMDYWYLSNRKLAGQMDSYFFKNTKLRDLDYELYEDAKWLYKAGNALEKIMAISLVGSVERIY